MAADPKIRTQGFIARQLGVSQPAVSGWLKGKPRPDDDRRALIAALTGGDISAEDWETSEERRRRLRGLERARAASKGAA
jgi:transcriptional regulator with XRE-family HTH domain